MSSVAHNAAHVASEMRRPPGVRMACKISINFEHVNLRVASNTHTYWIMSKAHTPPSPRRGALSSWRSSRFRGALPRLPPLAPLRQAYLPARALGLRHPALLQCSISGIERRSPAVSLHRSIRRRNARTRLRTRKCNGDNTSCGEHRDRMVSNAARTLACTGTCFSPERETWAIPPPLFLPCLLPPFC